MNYLVDLLLRLLMGCTHIDYKMYIIKFYRFKVQQKYYIFAQ